MIRIFAVQFPGYFLEHVLVAVESANSSATALHLPSPRRSPTILGTINPRLPAEQVVPVSPVTTNNPSKTHFPFFQTVPPPLDLQSTTHHRPLLFLLPSSFLTRLVTVQFFLFFFYVFSSSSRNVSGVNTVEGS